MLKHDPAASHGQVRHARLRGAHISHRRFEDARLQEFYGHRASPPCAQSTGPSLLTNETVNLMASRVSSAYARCKSSKNELSDVYPGILYWIQYHPITAGRATRVDSTRSAYCGMFNMKPTMRLQRLARQTSLHTAHPKSCRHRRQARKSCCIDARS